MSDRRNSVVSSSTVGKTAKSSGFSVYIADSSTIIASAMLNVNSRSSRNGGSGSTIMPRISTMSSGPASPTMVARSNPRRSASALMPGLL